MLKNVHRRDATLIVLMATIGAVLLGLSFIGTKALERRLLERGAEEQALGWARVIRDRLTNSDAAFSYGELSEKDQEVIKLVAEVGQVFRYKFFTPEGYIVIASRPEDIGQRNTRDYFHNEVKSGQTYVKVAGEKRMRELTDYGGGSNFATVAEAYIPVIKDGQFQGAIEVYMNASGLAHQIQGDMRAAQIGLLGLLIFFGLVGGFVLRQNIVDRNRQLQTISRAHESMAKAEEQVLQLNTELEQRVKERTSELNDANEKVQDVNEELERRVEERTQQLFERTEQLFKTNDQLYKANESFSRLNVDLEKRVEERTSELHKANENITRLNEDLERRVQERTAELNEANDRIQKMNEDLEQRVEERTAELNQANENVMRLNQELELRVEARTAELKEAQAELITKERLAALGQLTATVSHELRNPLGAIRTAVYLIGSKVKGQGLGVENALERADRSITRCDNIISELLDYTRQTDLSLETAPFDEWLEQVLDEQAVPQGVHLQKEIATQGQQLAFDQDRLRRVVINLFNNACEAMTEHAQNNNDERDYLLTIATQAIDDRIEVLFQDNGPGIDPETLEKIFEPLYSTKSFGVGLGLPTVRQIMEQHSGGIEIQSQPGQGTSVLIWLPVGRVDEKAA